MIEAASVASPRSYSPEVFAGGTDEREVLLDLLPRRWVTVARAERIMNGSCILEMLLRHAALGVYTFPGDQVPPCNDQRFFELASDVDWVALAALFQVYWLTTRMGRRRMGGQTARIATIDMGDWFEVGRGMVAVYRWWKSESRSRATTLPLPLYRPWQPESINRAKAD